jgi:hypothetical protein
MLKQFVLARSFKREASKLKSSDKYNCLPIETRQLLYIDRLIFSQIEYVFSSNHASVKFKELSSYYKLLFMFGDYGYDISAEMGKELDYLTKLYLVKA